jgi:hypothetical protein
MKCTVCGKGELKRCPDEPNMAYCSNDACAIRVPNHDGKIKFRGRPRKEEECQK